MHDFNAIEAFFTVFAGVGIAALVLGVGAHLLSYAWAFVAKDQDAAEKFVNATGAVMFGGAGLALVSGFLVLIF